MKRTKAVQLVRYVSPFGSPAYMTRDQAAAYLKRDDARWLDLGAAGMLTEGQRRVGAPRIEYPR